MFGKKVRISAPLHDKLKKAAGILHCSSVEEFAQRVLEAEADKIISSSEGGSKDRNPEDVKKIESQLRGLGYID